MNRIKAAVAAIVLVVALGGASAASAYIGPTGNYWTAVAKTPGCSPSVQMYAYCGGYGAFFADSGRAAWSQASFCSVMLVSGGWVDAYSGSCATDPAGGGTSFTNFLGELAPSFHINVCNRWYSTRTWGRVLLPGGWYSGATIAPGIQVRC